MQRFRLMKILFINKYDTSGGAAIAAWRLHEALQKSYKTENAFLVGIKRSGYDFVYETRKKGLENTLEKGMNFLFNKFGLQYVWFPFSTKRILKFTKSFHPDIIALQNIHGGYFDTTLIKKLSGMAPIVWTLHDMWAFTGNAAYTFGDESWKQMQGGAKEHKHFPQTGFNNGKWLLQRKKDIYTKSRLTIVSPSEWLQKLALQSPVLKGKKILHIPNGIDTSLFCPAENKVQIKQEFGISPEQKVLLFTAEKLMQSEQKGGAALLEILKKLDQEMAMPVTLLTLGQGNLPLTFEQLKVKPLGYVSDQKQIIKALQASDLFLFPTKADNLPNTLIEAIACGLPCITYDVGGCGEIIKNGENGFLVPPFEVNPFVEAIKGLLEDQNKFVTFSDVARKYAVENFEVSEMARRYFEVFGGLLKG